jgi:hypothetical protein
MVRMCRSVSATFCLVQCYYYYYYYYYYTGYKNNEQRQFLVTCLWCAQTGCRLLSLLDAEFLRSASKYLPVDTTSHPRRFNSSSASRLEVQISQTYSGLRQGLTFSKSFTMFCGRGNFILIYEYIGVCFISVSAETHDLCITGELLLQRPLEGHKF